jgi:hypothetical protein
MADVEISDEMRDSLRALTAGGRAVWQRFKRGSEDQLWYYGALAAAYRRLLPGQLAEELAEIVEHIRRE